MMQHLRNIFFLGIKEIIELMRDTCMVVLIIYSFSVAIYTGGVGQPDPVYRTSIAIVDEDNTQLSSRITDAFLPPWFNLPTMIQLNEVDSSLDSGAYTFALVIPTNFQKDTLAGKNPEIQLNVDATRMTQAFVGAGYVQQIAEMEIQKFLSKNNQQIPTPATLDLRDRFNPNLTPVWFGGINQLVNMVTILSIILVGAALIRERERGTLEHLLVMPVETFDIMCAKIWSTLAVVEVATLFAVQFVLRGMLDMPNDGSILLFGVGVALHLFAATSLGIVLACLAENMPQMGMLFILVLMPMNMLSGGQTPKESMPQWVQDVMKLAPTTHFVEFCQQIIFRGAGLEVVWKPFSALLLIGCALFFYAWLRFKKSAT